MKRLLFLCVSVLLVSANLVYSKTVNEKPFVIPELKEWKGGDGEFIPSSQTRIVYSSKSPELQQVADAFAADYLEMFGVKLQVVIGKAKAGDFVVELVKDKKIGDEGYKIKISDKVTILANKPVGAFWATRTLLQMTEQSESSALLKGEIVDFPDYPLRGFMLDCGRKFIPLHFLQDYVKFMAYYKMNTFHIHLNDNGFKQYFQDDWNKTQAAFRLECETFPGLTAQDGSYTKQEFIDLQKLGIANFVEIIPEIDIPAHSLAFAQYNPELGSEKYGMDHLDLFKPTTYEFFDKLFEEYLGGDNPVFIGEKVHVGTDEYSNKEKEVVEKFRYFTDYYIRYIESFGKQACVWGALTHANGETPVKSKDVVMWSWHNPYAQPDVMMEKGYQLVSIPDGLVYLVPNAGYYYDYLNTKHLYNNWTPANIGGKEFEDRHPQILGGMFAVWNDHTNNGISTKDIHHRVFPAMQTMAVKMWTGKSTSLSYDVFNEKRISISEAPGVNVLGKVGKGKEKVLSIANLKPRQKTGLKEIGYNYTVSFDIEGADEAKGTVLFSTPDTEFYLSDPIKGMMGYSRDGYLYTFRYKVKKGEKVNIKICGDNKNTKLYINGRLCDDMNTVKMWFNEGKSTMYYSQTLVFPLDNTGVFNSKIMNFEVLNYIEN
ncbi:hexosaminidase [Dysgonomonadaceae bacterium PH5-43]|nr:hexosaminidase [Dysgonomonadaceae bacterium PH5-43]